MNTWQVSAALLFNFYTMTSSSDSVKSDHFDVLSAFSNQLADAVDRAGQSVVAVNARRRMSSSGVYWRSRTVVTADHTINRDEEISVTLPDGQTTSATIVGRDPGSDLALLQLQEVDLPIPELGDPAALRVGQLVLAIARSSDGATSASMGVIGSMGGAWRKWHGGRADGLIRPALNLYPGFSGGPLVSAAGQVIGINTAGPRHRAVSITVATINRVVDQLLQTGRIARGYLGLGMQPVQLPETVTRTFNLLQASGVIVVSLDPEGPGDRAGVLLGDIVTSLGGTAIADVGDVYTMLGFEQVGQPLTAQIIRGGTLIEVTITVGEKPGRDE